MTAQRCAPGRTRAVAAGTLLILVAFTTPLTTLASTAAGLGAGPGALAALLARERSTAPKDIRVRVR